MTDICLISPPSRAYNHYRPPIALMLLSSVLEKNGISNEIIDIKSEIGAVGEEKKRIVSDILAQVKKYEPNIIGISCYTPEFNEVIELCNEIRQTKRDVVIVIGGVHATLVPKDFFYKQSPIDFVVIGEGEFTLVDLINNIKRSGNFQKVDGIAYIDGESGEYIQTASRALIANIDEMPWPNYKKVDMGYYTTPNPYSIRGMLFSAFYVLVGRGCPSQCTFCVSAKMRKIMATGKSLRCRSAKNVVDELQYLKSEYEIDAFYFIDDNFTILSKLVMEICDELISRKLNLKWGCSSRINTLSEELLGKMKEAGCIQIDFGVESGSDDVLKRLKKGVNTSQIKNVFEICRNFKIRTFCNILINVPEETEKELQLTLKLLDEIKPSVTSFNIFIPFLGTEIYNNSGLNLSSSEYQLLSMPPRELVKDKRFRFAKHNIDFGAFYSVNHKKYNSPFVFFPSYLSPSYWKHILRSKKKKDYFSQIRPLIKEFIKQVSQ